MSLALSLEVDLQKNYTWSAYVSLDKQFSANRIITSKYEMMCRTFRIKYWFTGMLRAKIRDAVSKKLHIIGPNLTAKPRESRAAR